ncbi:response regulator [Paenibacillus gansuensis]|uniref:Response regulator n=1 Tax=Paenibacillus gansuensis TaxID=306542 RepID=A0ABW5PLD6_9BACL
MKLLIADDEHLVRLSLRSMIQDMDPDWHIVGEAANGEDMLELVAEHKPNVAIVDIRMPKMNGLDAIRLGKSCSPMTKWVIVSGYSDFTYAQEALKLCASDYLLKPVSPGDLERALQETYKDNQELIALHNRQFENNLQALLNGILPLHQEDREGIFHRGTFIACVFLLDSAPAAPSESEAQQGLYCTLAKSVSGGLAYGVNLAIVPLPSGNLAAIGAWDKALCPEGRSRIVQFLNHAAELASGNGDGLIRTTCIDSGECRGFAELSAKLQLLQKWYGLRTILGIGRRYSYPELAEAAAVPERLEAGRLLAEARMQLQNGYHLQYRRAVDELETALSKTSGIGLGELLGTISECVAFTCGIAPGSALTDKEIITALVQYGERCLRQSKPKDGTNADLVQQVIHYIEQHYTEDIGIGIIAGQLAVSPNYLSTLFHKKTGVTFVKYLTRIRLAKAEELLVNSNLQVREIAERVGYLSTRHFTKLFTGAYGIYPSDYRKK